MLRLDQVAVRRGRTVTLEDITLPLQPGKTLAVVGESGAGKSTLIAAILGLLRPWRGTITWDGAPVRACRPALVMQEPRAAFNPVLSLRQSVPRPGKNINPALVVVVFGFTVVTINFDEHTRFHHLPPSLQFSLRSRSTIDPTKKLTKL